MLNKVINIMIIGAGLIATFFCVRWIQMDDSKMEALIVFIDIAILPILFWAKTKTSGESKEEERENFEVTIRNHRVIDSPNGIDYRFQIDFSLHAFEHPVYIREIRLEQRAAVSQPQIINCYKVYSDAKKDYLSLPYEEHKETLETVKSMIASEIVVQKDEWLFLTITGAATGERLSDGFEPFVTKNWILFIEYNDKREIQTLFDFDIHHKSQKIPVEYRYINFSD